MTTPRGQIEEGLGKIQGLLNQVQAEIQAVELKKVECPNCGAPEMHVVTNAPYLRLTPWGRDPELTWMLSCVLCGCQRERF